MRMDWHNPKPPLPSYMISESRTSEYIFDSLFNNFTIFDRITDVVTISFIIFSIYLIISPLLNKPIQFVKVVSIDGMITVIPLTEWIDKKILEANK